MWKMKLNTCITTVNDNSVLVTELTDGQQYLPDNSGLTAKNRFAFKDTVSIDIFKLNALEKVDYTPAVIVDRSNSKDVKIDLNRDGWFTAIHIVLPNAKWVHRELSKQGSIIHTYNIVYFVDDNEIYTVKNKVIERSSIQNLLDETCTNTTISRCDTDYISIKILNDLWDNSYKELFKNRIYNGGCKMNACEANRLDAIIHLTKHYVRIGQLAEAERVIEKSNYFRNQKLDMKLEHKPFSSGCGCQ